MSAKRRRAKAARNRIANENRWRKNAKHPLCMNGCGEPGPHFVPPSFGDKGFFMCKKKDDK